MKGSTGAPVPVVTPATGAKNQPRMVQGRLGRSVKYAMIVANMVILVGGIVVFSIGVWTLAERTFMERLLGSDLYVSAASILIATGVIVTVISFLGCFGAFKEIKCMLLTFFIILLMIFVIMLVGGILGYVFKNEVDERMYSEMVMSVVYYKNDTKVTDAWDAVQRKFECCGMTIDGEKKQHDAYVIWVQKSPAFMTPGGIRVPRSCCESAGTEEQIRQCMMIPNRQEGVYKIGCYDRMKDFVKEHAMVVGGVGIGISCVLVLGMILSCALFMLIR